jgi:hypothetical protein
MPDDGQLPFAAGDQVRDRGAKGGGDDDGGDLGGESAGVQSDLSSSPGMGRRSILSKGRAGKRLPIRRDRLEKGRGRCRGHLPLEPGMAQRSP